MGLSLRDDSALIAELRAQLAAERERSAELMRTIVEMRREGFNAPTALPTIEPQAPELPETVLDAIGQRARHGSEVWHQTAREAERLIREGMDPTEAAEAVLQGEATTIDWS